MRYVPQTVVNFLFLVSLVAACFMSVPALAQKKGSNDRRDEQRENERVQKAEKEVTQSRKALNEFQGDLRTALKQLDDAQDKLVLAKRGLNEAKDSAEAELGAKLGIPEAIAAVNEKRKRFEELSKPILDKLHARPEWKSLETQVAKAKSEREALRENVELEDDEREKQLKALSEIIAKPFNVETQAIQADADCMKARKEVDDASAKLVETRKKLSESKIDAHPLVAAAKKKVAEVDKTVASSEKALTAVRSSATKAQRSLQQALSELSRAKQADAADSNNSNKGKKK